MRPLAPAEAPPLPPAAETKREAAEPPPARVDVALAAEAQPPPSRPVQPVQLAGAPPLDDDEVSVALADDLVDVVEDVEAKVWVPNNAVFGRGLRTVRREDRAPPPDGYRARLRSAATLPAPVPYVSHNCLAGWKLTPLAAGPRRR